MKKLFFKTSVIFTAAVLVLSACGNNRGNVVKDPVSAGKGPAGEDLSTIMVRFGQNSARPITDMTSKLTNCTVGAIYPDCVTEG